MKGGECATKRENDVMKPVAIIGGGITGLTAGFYLQRAGIPVTAAKFDVAGVSHNLTGR